ncbi:MAG: hypothetical protein R3F56_23800 [Planctomycetota bacterium]
MRETCGLWWMLLGLLCGPAVAQRVWIVDVAGGPGTDFTQIAAALASPLVSGGDVLRVRAGDYEAFVTDKGVAVLGEGTVRIGDFSGTLPTTSVVVQGLPAGAVFTMANVLVGHSCTNARAAIMLNDTAGRVHLENVDTQGIGYPTWLQPTVRSVWLLRCRLLTWNGGRVAGGGGIYADTSTLALTGVVSYGIRGTDLGIRIIPSTPGLELWSSEAFVCATDLVGGNGDGNVSASPGLRANVLFESSRVHLAGAATNSVRAGFGGPTPAIRMRSNTLIYDPTVQLVPSGGAAAIESSGLVEARPVGFVAGHGAPLGGTAEARVHSPPGTLVFLALGLPTVGQASPFGPLYLDLASMVPLAVGVQGALGVTVQPLPVPSVPELRGLAIGLQAAVTYPPGNETGLTNPTAIVLD